MEMDNILFRNLTPEEAEEFKAWAKENYKPGSEIELVWHPIVRVACEAINKKIEEIGKELAQWIPNACLDMGDTDADADEIYDDVDTMADMLGDRICDAGMQLCGKCYSESKPYMVAIASQVAESSGAGSIEKAILKLKSGWEA